MTEKSDAALLRVEVHKLAASLRQLTDRVERLEKLIRRGGLAGPPPGMST